MQRCTGVNRAWSTYPAVLPFLLTYCCYFYLAGVQLLAREDYPRARRLPGQLHGRPALHGGEQLHRAPLAEGQEVQSVSAQEVPATFS